MSKTDSNINSALQSSHSCEGGNLELPTSWVYTQLGAVTKYGKTTKAELSDASQGDWILELEDVEKDSSRLLKRVTVEARKFKSSKNKFKTGDVLYGKLRPYLNKIIIADRPGYCSTEIIPIDAEPFVSNRYLFYWLKSESFQAHVNAASYGVNMPRLGTKDGLQAPLILPPLAEQKVIADKLDELLAQVNTVKARLDAIPTILKRFRQSVLAAAVSGKLTEEWRHENNAVDKNAIIQFIENERLNSWITEQKKSAHRKGIPFNLDSNIKKYKKPTNNYSDELNLTAIQSAPEGWFVSNLDSISISVTGKTPPTTDEKNWGGKIPFITPSQIKINGHIVAPERYVTDKAAEKTPILPSGSILIVCIGTIGKVGLLEKESAFNQQINALIPTAAIKKEFLFMWAQTLHTWLNKTSSAVVNAAIINKSRLCSAPCPVPPIEEQTEIVRRVEQLFTYADQVEQQVKNAQARVNQLTQSILAKAFRGELTEQWRQDNPELISGDNSAAALLERIKAERAAAKPAKKTKGRKSDA
ncbi:restriction endonuclease subunit S [Zhongshania aliphaticivorans]|uniref:restriction endonuclease subunit S n=1 Tax=Zhongshania aliphaticivorans TaxID=1470434 RepID=UPI0012E58BFB|nr:restriction endonuclease subunit S [Zhongshania aliphaticivorans]CAA0093992.1 Type-1 restriction enzyme EcoKI specificity protein [Zhongshania aliphaticivorans]